MSKTLENRWKQPCFDRIQQPDIEDINRISRPFVQRVCDKYSTVIWAAYPLPKGRLWVLLSAAWNNSKRLKWRNWWANENGIQIVFHLKAFKGCDGVRSRWGKNFCPILFIFRIWIESSWAHFIIIHTIFVNRGVLKLTKECESTVKYYSCFR